RSPRARAKNLRDPKARQRSAPGREIDEGRIVPRRARNGALPPGRDRLRLTRSVDSAPRRYRPARGSVRPRGDERAMKVIIPLAGKGTRLRPHTHLTPKPMLKIAGKPVIDYVMDDLQKLGGVEQVIYITGHLKETVETYTRTKYPWKSVFVEQKEQRG